jgi:hypothetical protein
MAKVLKRKSVPVFVVLLIVIGVFVLAGLSKGQRNTLIVKKVATGAVLDGVAEALWDQAQPLTFKVVAGQNLPGRSTEVTLRALRTADMAHFLLQYKVPTESVRRSPWQRQADGSWKKLIDPDDKGGDNNVSYEDKFVILWNINSLSFDKKGCASACHVGEGKPYGNKYTKEDGARLDLWHWKGVRTGTVGQIDDQYVDSTNYDKDKFPEAGRKSDPKTGGGYVDNVSDDKKGPKFALKGNTPAPPYWILDSEKELLDNSKYNAADEVPGIIVAPFAGDRGDFAAKYTYKDDLRTVEFSRKLVTGSEFDVQFSDMKEEYSFGVAVFDNAQVRHALTADVLKMKFE